MISRAVKQPAEAKTLPLPFAAKTVRVDPVVGEVDGMSTVAWDVSVDGGTTWTTGSTASTPAPTTIW